MTLTKLTLDEICQLLKEFQDLHAMVYEKIEDGTATIGHVEVIQSLKLKINNLQFLHKKITE